MSTILVYGGVLIHYVEHAHAKNDWSTVRRIAVDETSARRGRSYVTMCSTMKTHVSAPDWSTGCGVQALGAFAEALRRHEGDPSQIEAIAMDMSTSYIKGASQYFPPASIVFRQVPRYPEKELRPGRQ